MNLSPQPLPARVGVGVGGAPDQLDRGEKEARDLVIAAQSDTPSITFVDWGIAAA